MFKDNMAQEEVESANNKTEARGMEGHYLSMNKSIGFEST
jgi:hypothetical protein